ncbi:MAG: metallophosphoesterase [Lacunisphaera sp.]
MPAVPDDSTSEPASRRLSRRRFLASFVTAGGIGLYTWRVEPTWLEITHRDLSIALLPPALAGKTLVQLSDIHLGPQVSDDYIRRTFAAVATLAPDFVVHPGDLVTYAGPEVIERAKPLLTGFPSGKLGTVAILGNHDYGSQCKPPFLPPPILPVKNRRHTAGKFALSGNRRLDLDRGVGHLLRVRFNVRPEVTAFTLRPA